MGTGFSKGVGLFLSAAAALCVLLINPRGGSVFAGDDGSHVQLDCKISAAAGATHLWDVELRRPSGELVRQTTMMNGDAAHFKNLSPGIYSLCILGARNRESCESVDLNPPPDKRSFRFSRYLKAPEHILNRKDLNRVSATSLAVPAQAREELLRSEQSELHGDTDQIVAHLRKAIEICPSYADALNNLGSYYHRAGKHEESIQYFRKVTELEPDFYGGWVNLGGALLAMGQFKEALEANSKAYDLQPNDSIVVSQTALNYFYLHDLPAAKRLFEKVQGIDPASAIQPELFLTHIALAEHNKEEARDYINQFLKIHPNAPQAAHMRDLLNNLDTIQFYNENQVAQSKH